MKRVRTTRTQRTLRTVLCDSLDELLSMSAPPEGDAAAFDEGSVVGRPVADPVLVLYVACTLDLLRDMLGSSGMEGGE